MKAEAFISFQMQYITLIRSKKVPVQGDPSTLDFIRRGNSWDVNGSDCRSAFNLQYLESAYLDEEFGFRIVCNRLITKENEISKSRKV